jgi:hypothetical protein
MAGTARRDETKRRGLDEAGHAKALIEELSAPELKSRRQPSDRLLFSPPWPN